ncbi:MAG: sulfur carrier protein ThiS [Lentihominibacter sp.]|nr:sulfur carrier protein ThiS [Clostridiales bacterium]MDY2680778.1 sulfur carrier protein ThiS [Lentihominibacter sp.]
MEDKIRITINKKEEFIGNNTTVKELIQSRGLKKAAVWVNGSQLLKAQYDTFVLHEGDEVKLLRIMAGG